MEYKYSKAVHDHFIFEEGMRHKAYKDTEGYWTIGIGHMLGHSDGDEWAGMYWSDVKALMVLEHDIDTNMLIVHDLFPEYNILPGHVQMALMDMGFNLGNRLRQFKQTVRLIHAGKYKEAAASAAASKWAEQVPNRSKRTLKLLAGD